MQIKDMKDKKKFLNFITKIGNNKVLAMIQLMHENELKLWLPSMLCSQLEVFCKVLSIKQSGKKKDKMDRIINSIKQK